MKSIDIIEIKSINRNDLNQIAEVAGLYANVFAGPPWYEATKCLTSGSFYGADTTAGAPCPDCSNPLSEAYPKDETTQYILGELGKTNPIGLLAFVNSELAGFSWGYRTTPKELVESSKWKTPDMKQKVYDLLADYGVSGSLFFGSETGVDPKFRDKGLGKKLVRARFDEILRSGEKYALVRTNVNSPMYGIIEGSSMSKGLDGFFQILGPISNKKFWTGNWELKKKTGKQVYANDMVDTENPDRVLFLFKRSLYDRIQREPSPAQLMTDGMFI